MTIETRPFDAGLGAEVRGVDIRQPLSPQVRDALQAAWHKHLVLLIRDQPMNDDQLIAFTRNFGEPDRAPLSELDRFDGVKPEVTVVSNIVRNGKAIGTLGSGEANWHTDSSCDELPPGGSLLHAIEVPPSGGNTHFCNMYTAYERLPEDIKLRIKDARAIHDASYTSGGALRQGREEVRDVTKAPGARHPLVRTHPGTGRKALFLGRRLNSYIIGLSVEESEKLLDLLWSYTIRDDATWGHVWRAGDLVMWDNRCVMHRRDSFDPAVRRLMHRTQYGGERPF